MPAIEQPIPAIVLAGSCSENARALIVTVALQLAVARNFAETTDYMAYRKLQRQYRGDHKTTHRALVVGMFFGISVLLGLLKVEVFQGSILTIALPHRETWTGLSVFLWISGVIATVIVVSFIAQIDGSLILRWTLYCSYFFLLLFFATLIIGYEKPSTATAISGNPIGRPNSTLSLPSQTAWKSRLRHVRSLTPTSLPHAIDREDSLQKKKEKTISPTAKAVAALLGRHLYLLFVISETVVLAVTCFLTYGYTQLVRNGWLRLHDWETTQIDYQDIVVPGRSRGRQTIMRSKAANEKSLWLARIASVLDSLEEGSSRHEGPGHQEGPIFGSGPGRSRTIGRLISLFFPRMRLSSMRHVEVSKDLPVALDEVTFAAQREQRVMSDADSAIHFDRGLMVSSRCVPSLARAWNAFRSWRVWPGDSWLRRWTSPTTRRPGHQFVFLGQVDRFGRPSGFGRWIEECPHGEQLVGFWEAGRPVAPFMAREYNTGSAFMSVRVGFGRFNGFGHPAGLFTWGVASVECSISGAFFRGYPIIYRDECPPIHERLLLSLPLAPHRSQNDEKERMMCNWAAEDPRLVQALGDGLAGAFARHCVEAAWVQEELHSKGHMPSFGNPRTIVTAAVDGSGELFVVGCIPTDPCSSRREIRVHVVSENENGVPNEDDLVPRDIPINGGAAPSRTTSDRVERFRSCRTDWTSYGSQEFAEAESTCHAEVPRSLKRLSIEGWTDSSQVSGFSEVAVFVHGYNSPLEFALGNFAQLISMCVPPPYIKPFVFSWEGGSSPFHFRFGSRQTRRRTVAASFAHFLETMRAIGCTRLHLIAHSLGARLMLNGLRLAAGRDLFKLCDENDERGSLSKLRLLSVTLLHPDYNLQEFVKRDYATLRARCSLISIFGDSNDLALRAAELVTRQASLGRTLFGLRRGGRNEGREPTETLTEGTLDSGTVPVVSDDSDTAGPNWDMEAWESVGNDPFLMRLPFGGLPQWLDVDVIDTTYITYNVHFIRHTFYNVNREIIEDIRDILSMRRRAWQRSSRLDRREGNVWAYRVAPSHLGSIYA
eukprot:Polyplicarium_translucidae@DN1664_c0_g2_i2.p1